MYYPSSQNNTFPRPILQFYHNKINETILQVQTTTLKYMYASGVTW